MPLLAHIHVLEVLPQIFFTWKFTNKDCTEVLLFLGSFFNVLSNMYYGQIKSDEDGKIVNAAVLQLFYFCSGIQTYLLEFYENWHITKERHKYFSCLVGKKFACWDKGFCLHENIFSSKNHTKPDCSCWSFSPQTTNYVVFLSVCFSFWFFFFLLNF